MSGFKRIKTGELKILALVVNGGNRYDLERMTVRITDAELAGDTHAILARVQKGDEVIVELDHRPIAVITTPHAGRKLTECIALAIAHEEAVGWAPLPDPDFAKDVQAAIDSQRDPFQLPEWD